MKNISVEGGINYNEEDDTLYDITHKDNIEHNENLLDSIIQHPFIDSITFDKLQLVETCYCIIYRIQDFNGYSYIEYYIDNNFLKFCFKTTYKLMDIYKDIISDINIKIKGIKKFKGIYKYNNDDYVFIKVRTNTDTKNWINLWDIVVEKHYFGEKIHNNVIDFFTNNNNISDLKLNKHICLKPNILYCHIDEKYLSYVSNNKSIQYCQDDSLIKLHEFKNHDNIRVICFMDFDDSIYIKSNNESLQKTGFVIDKINKCWIFKNEDKLYITCKL